MLWRVANAVDADFEANPRLRCAGSGEERREGGGGACAPPDLVLYKV